MGVRFSAPVKTGSEANPASYTTGTESFPGVKQPGRGIDHPTPSSAEIKERVELYLYFPSRPSWPVLGRNFTFTFTARKRNLLFVHPYSGQTNSAFFWLLIFLIEVTTNAELITRTCSNCTLYESCKGLNVVIPLCLLSY